MVILVVVLAGVDLVLRVVLVLVALVLVGQILIVEVVEAEVVKFLVTLSRIGLAVDVGTSSPIEPVPSWAKLVRT